MPLGLFWREYVATATFRNPCRSFAMTSSQRSKRARGAARGVRRRSIAERGMRRDEARGSLTALRGPRVHWQCRAREAPIGTGRPSLISTLDTRSDSHQAGTLSKPALVHWWHTCAALSRAFALCAIATMAALPVNIPMPAARPSVEPGPPALGPTLGIADGATPAAGGVEPIFFRGPAYKEKECTKVFGYIGLPAGLQPGETCPGMVLLHGGGGTAFDVWVKLWNARGYAAITFDQCGDIPSQPLFGDGAPHARHSDGVALLFALRLSATRRAAWHCRRA